MRFFLCINLLVLSSQSHAVFQELYQGFQKSDYLSQLELNTKIIKESYNIKKSKNDFILKLSAVNSNSSLKRVSPISPEETLLNTYSLRLEKQTFLWGQFSFEHLQVENDLSKWSTAAAAKFSADQLYESKNTLSYTYNFLNNPLALDWEFYSSENKANKLEQEIKEDKEHLGFFMAYLDAKIRLMTERLNFEFISRAKKRVSQVQRRVRDGLSRKVDLYQAQLALLSQGEQKIKNEVMLNESIETLEDLLKIEITPEIKKIVNWSFKDYRKALSLGHGSAIKEVKHRELLKILDELTLKQEVARSKHQLQLGLSYSMNAVENKKSKSVSNAIGDTPYREQTVRLSYIIPLGMEKNSSLKRRMLVKKSQNELALNNLKSEFGVKNKILNHKIREYIKAIELINKKISFSQKIIKENQKYYQRGQISFEELLKSEENYINAKLSLVNLYYLYENVVAQKYYIHGSIRTFLGVYVD